MYATCSLGSPREAPTEPHSFCYVHHALQYIHVDPRPADRLCPVCTTIVERLADGILGVKHGVAAFLIQFLECCYNAATCCCRSLLSGRQRIISSTR